MSGRVIGIFIVTVILLIMIFLLLKGRTPFGGSNTSFAINPEKEITRIEFRNDTVRLILEKETDGWFVNNGSETRKSSISFILRILTGMEIKSPVTSELLNSEIISKDISPVRVRVFHKRKLLKSFLVYRTSSNVYGNIMKLREGSKPYIVYFPGNEVEIGSVFNPNELFWKPFTVFELLPSEISSVTIENKRDPSTSFMIIKDDKGFILSDINTVFTGWDTTRVARYISYFINIPFESWAFELSPEEKQEIIDQPPLYRITVIKADGNRISLTLWERVVDDKGVQKTDSDRLWAKTESSPEIFVIRYFDIDPLLKKSSYFLPD